MLLVEGISKSRVLYVNRNIENHNRNFGKGAGAFERRIEGSEKREKERMVFICLRQSDVTPMRLSI